MMYGIYKQVVIQHRWQYILIRWIIISWNCVRVASIKSTRQFGIRWPTKNDFTRFPDMIHMISWHCGFLVHQMDRVAVGWFLWARIIVWYSRCISASICWARLAVAEMSTCFNKLIPSADCFAWLSFCTDSSIMEHAVESSLLNCSIARGLLVTISRAYKVWNEAIGYK